MSYIHYGEQQEKKIRIGSIEKDILRTLELSRSADIGTDTERQIARGIHREDVLLYKSLNSLIEKGLIGKKEFKKEPDEYYMKTKAYAILKSPDIHKIESSKGKQIKLGNTQEKVLKVIPKQWENALTISQIQKKLNMKSNPAYSVKSLEAKGLIQERFSTVNPDKVKHYIVNKRGLNYKNKKPVYY